MQQAELNFSRERLVLSVSQLVNDLRIEVESRFRDIWVQGEVSNFKKSSAGHCYFTLKDSDAQISTVCFRMQAQMLRFAIEDGMDVVARGSASIYPQRGQLQFIVETMEPLGRGALQLAFEQLKAKLASEGLFEASIKKSLPVLPSKVGVVTSPSGAAIQDILRVLSRRNDRVHILVYPVKVQGSGAAAEIAAGIRYLDVRPDVDVIIVGRGGGSIEDLWAFNEETVARAIFAARKPVISAVGHEIDFTISDFVADIRAATPSAAAEMVSRARIELQRIVAELENRASQAVRLLIHGKRRQLQILSSNRAFVDAESRLRVTAQRLDDLTSRIALAAERLCAPKKVELEALQRELGSLVRRTLEQRSQALSSLSRELNAFSPEAVLDRGYAIVTNEEGLIVRRPSDVEDRERIQIRVREGSFTARKEEQSGV